MVNGEGIGYPTQPTRGPAEGREIPSYVWTHPRPKINLGDSIELPESHWWQSFSLFYDFIVVTQNVTIIITRLKSWPLCSVYSLALFLSARS